MGARHQAALQRASAQAHQAKQRQQKQQHTSRQQKQPTQANLVAPTHRAKPQAKLQRAQADTMSAHIHTQQRPTFAAMAPLSAPIQPVGAAAHAEYAHVAKTPNRRTRIETRPIASLHALPNLRDRRDDPREKNQTEDESRKKNHSSLSARATPQAAPASRVSTPGVSPLLPIAPSVDLELAPSSSFSSLPLRTYMRTTAAGSRGLVSRYGRTERRGLFSLLALNWVVPVALFHAMIAVGAALAVAATLLAAPSGTSWAAWALSLAVLSGLGAALAYQATQANKTALAALWLTLSALGMLAWILVAFGPRLAFVMALIPGYIVLALRTRGRTSAILVALLAAALFALARVAMQLGWLHPAFVLTPDIAAVVDGLGPTAGMVIMLGALLIWHAGSVRAWAAAQASEHEAAFLRRNVAQAREHAEQDADHLTRALGEAIQGRGIPPIHVHGSFSPLGEMINATAERLATLQRDREERLRVQGALAALIRAVERAWLGQPWAWPAPSGTSVDDLVTLLYTPRPQDALKEAKEGEEKRSYTHRAVPPQMSQPSHSGRPSWPDGVSLDAHTISHEANYFSRSSAKAVDARQRVAMDGDAFGRYSPPAWEQAPEIESVPWPQSWPTPLPDLTPDDLDSLEESASRRITPPPQHRRWNE